LIEKFKYTVILGWSLSRYETFKMCKRQYFYEYYPKFDDEYSEYKIKELKTLSSLPLAIGTITHDIIASILGRFLKSESTLNQKRFWDFVRKLAERYCRENTFSEIYYGEIEKINIEELFSSIKRNLENLLSSERFKWIKEKAIKNKHKWIIEPPGFGEFRLDEMKTYCKVDFLFPFDGKIYIIDWKTGKEDRKKHEKQLMGYVCWASYHFKNKPADYLAISAYLTPTYREKEYRFKNYEIENFIHSVRKETEEMHSFCADISENIPVKKENFSKTSNEKICNFCNYREICK
jgi:CRISPR/Cas system-associated exonuclease Cas4 (RecB family)